MTNAADSSNDALGVLIGRYTFVREIATGGMATVFLARTTEGGVTREVAIKRLHPHLATEEEFVTMFFDEARLAARVRHPNVVTTLEIDDLDGISIVMEYVEGPTLLDMARCEARRGAKLPLPVVARLAFDLLAGLHAAHELRASDGSPLDIVHRDVSPHNVLVGVDGVAKLTDFGVARASERLAHTRDGKMKGKLAYMAPEQVTSDHCDRRADVFASGVVIWELLTGRRLFAGSGDAQTLYALLHGEIPRVRSVVPELPQALDDAVAVALSRSPDDRWPSAEAFAHALSATLKPCARTVVSAFAKRAFLEEHAPSRPSAPSAPSRVRLADQRNGDRPADETVLEPLMELDEGDVLRSSPPATASTPPRRVSMPHRAPTPPDADDDDLVSTMLIGDRERAQHSFDPLAAQPPAQPPSAAAESPAAQPQSAVDASHSTEPSPPRAVFVMAIVAVTLALAALLVTFARR